MPDYGEAYCTDHILLLRAFFSVLFAAKVVAGGGAVEMELSKALRDHSKTIKGKQQLIMSSYAKALEIIPRQLVRVEKAANRSLMHIEVHPFQSCVQIAAQIAAIHVLPSCLCPPSAGFDLLVPLSSASLPCSLLFFFLLPCLYVLVYFLRWNRIESNLIEIASKADNAGFDATDLLNRLRQKHARDGEAGKWFGVDVDTEGETRTQTRESDELGLGLGLGFRVGVRLEGGVTRRIMREGKIRARVRQEIRYWNGGNRDGETEGEMGEPEGWGLDEVWVVGLRLEMTQ